MKILVAEDTKSNLAYLEACIIDAGYDVVTATNGVEAVEAFDRHKPDLILLDVIMPEMSGIVAAEKIRERTRSSNNWIPIIFISAMDDDSDVVKGLEAGRDDYICKPVSQVVLNAKLHAMQRIYKMQQQLDIANKQLKRIADYDALTGLANRRKFNKDLEAEWVRATRNGKQLSLCISDVDFFKQYNDTYGHQAGDDALCTVASALFNAIRRPGDLVCRYGGEEFAIILPDTDRNGALKMIERGRSSVEEAHVAHSGSTASSVITISAGFATVEPSQFDAEEGVKLLLKSADDALYVAKSEGRNCIRSNSENVLVATSIA
ncbi:MAG: diguanylate cyclase [Gammaproteobacteria bacterium]